MHRCFFFLKLLISIFHFHVIFLLLPSVCFKRFNFKHKQPEGRQPAQRRRTKVSPSGVTPTNIRLRTLLKRCLSVSAIFEFRIHMLFYSRRQVCNYVYFFQLSELEQRVLEAEGRAEEAEDKVSVKSDAFNFGGWGSSSLPCNALAFIAFIDYFSSRREFPWTWRLSADRTTRN